MPQYMLSVHHGPGDDEVPTDAAVIEQMFADVGAFNERAQAAGIWVFAGGLESIEASTTVDNRGSETIISDGPFAESKEWLGGFWIFELPDLDAALSWAADGSKACRGRVEVRPFQSE
jgi:hypothetical protein